MSEKNIHKDDLDDIIEIASMLQQKEEASQQISLEEVEDVAKELGIAPEKVKEALSFLQKQRAEERTTAEEESKAQKKRTMVIGGSLAAVVLVVGSILFGLASSADTEMGNLSIEAHKKESQLKNVIDRQAELTTQLLSMMGGNVSGLDTLQQQLLSEEDLNKKIELNRKLSMEMAKAIATLPPTENDSDSQARLNFQYEVTGGQNRISTEQKRYDEALEVWRAAGKGLGPKLAYTIGWIDRPPE